jgi:triacylglycerol esterase/lipase EstA (alpha/beta hydrolase family)
MEDTFFKKNRPPIILLYGLGATPRTISRLRDRLKKDDYPVLSLNLGGLFGLFNTESIASVARVVHNAIEELHAEVGFNQKLTLLCHSKGGLIGHYYLKKLGGQSRVRRMITLASPHQGNPVAGFFSKTPLKYLIQSLPEMAPDSTLIKQLWQTPLPPRVDFYSLYSRTDTVCPYPCPVLPPQPRYYNVEIESITHSEFLLKKSVYHLIVHALESTVPRSLLKCTEDRLRHDGIWPKSQSTSASETPRVNKPSTKRKKIVSKSTRRS